MQKVFENIIEKLEELENVFIKGNSHNVAAGISRAIEIVKQEAEQYTSTVHSEYYEKVLTMELNLFVRLHSIKIMDGFRVVIGCLKLDRIV